MFASGQYLLGYGIVGIRNGEVDDDFDIVVLEQFLDSLGLYAELFCARIGGRQIDIGARPYFDVSKHGRQPQICSRYIAATDNPDTKCPGHFALQLRNFLRIRWNGSQTGYRPMGYRVP